MCSPAPVPIHPIARTGPGLGRDRKDKAHPGRSDFHVVKF